MRRLRSGFEARTLARVTAALLAMASSEAAAATAAGSDAPPDHGQAIESLSLAEGEAFAKLIADYDRYLAAHPQDVSVQVERCRFLGGASCSDDDERCPHWDEYELCLDGLEARFPGAAPVHLLRLETLWGDEAIDLAKSLLEGPSLSWAGRDLARIHEKLAQIYGARARKQPSLALDHARQAMDLDPSIDLTLVAARALETLGKPHEAVQMLVSRGPDAKNVWEERQKIELLLDLGAPDEAAHALALLGNPPDSDPDHLLEARVFGRAGRVDEARTALDLALQDPSESWQKRKILQQRRMLELAFGDADTALAAHESWRQEAGPFGDPLLRERVRLSLKHPSTPWRARDWIDLLGLAVVLLVLVSGVGALLVPIHYVGLVRERRRGSGPAPPGRFGLRHCWYALVVMAFASLPMLYMDGFDWMGELGDGEDFSFGRIRATPLPDGTAAFGGTLTVAIELAALALLLRRGDRQLFRLQAWSLRQTLSVVAISLIAYRLCIGLYTLLLQQLVPGEACLGLAAVSGSPLISQVTRAIAHLYGLPVLLLYMAVAAPLAEEFAFRGVLLQGLGRYLPAWLANALQAALFASLHEQWKLFPLFMAFGLLCGALARRSRSLVAPILFHAGNNAVAFMSIARALAPH